MTDVDIETMIASLRALASPSFATQVAKEALEPVLAIARESAAAGTSPTGEAWRARKDGSRALSKAADAITARVLGTVLQLEVAYPYSIHHFQDGATRPRRQILPDGDLPPKMSAAVAAAAARVFARTMGGR